MAPCVIPHLQKGQPSGVAWDHRPFQRNNMGELAGSAWAARRYDSRTGGSSRLCFRQAAGFPSPDPNSAFSQDRLTRTGSKRTAGSSWQLVGLERLCIRGAQGPDRQRPDPWPSPPHLRRAHPPPGHRVLGTLCFSSSDLGCSWRCPPASLVAWRPACLLSPFPFFILGNSVCS